MNVLLQALERDGFVTRPAAAPVGKALPTRLTPRARRTLEPTSAAGRGRMLSARSPAEQRAALQSMIRALGPEPADAALQAAAASSSR